MSVIIAIKDKNKIVMGCDSQATIGQIKSKVSQEHSKIFEIKGLKHSLMGVVGSCRDSQLISVADEIIDPLTKLTEEINYEYVVKNIYNNIYTVLVTNNRIDRDANGYFVNFTKDDFLFAFKDQAYWSSGSDGSVEEIEDYLVVGSGAEIAMGVLENNKDKTPEERIKEAIKACNDKTVYIDNNVVIKRT